VTLKWREARGESGRHVEQEEGVAILLHSGADGRPVAGGRDRGDRAGDEAGWQYNFDRLKETVRYECEHCGHVIRDTPTRAEAAEQRRERPLGGEEPECAEQYASLLLERAVAVVDELADQVVEFLAANSDAMERLQRRSRITSTRRGGAVDGPAAVCERREVHHLRARIYDPREPWARGPEVRTIDVQAGRPAFLAADRAWAMARNRGCSSGTNAGRSRK
jgi:hypothetical protein